MKPNPYFHEIRNYTWSPSGLCSCVSINRLYYVKDCPNCLGHGVMPIPLEDLK